MDVSAFEDSAKKAQEQAEKNCVRRTGRLDPPPNHQRLHFKTTE